jgi:hypothetical protein
MGKGRRAQARSPGRRCSWEPRNTVAETADAARPRRGHDDTVNESLPPDLALSAFATLAAGYAMVAAGLRKKLLRWNEPRVCPSCRHPRRDCTCVR